MPPANQRIASYVPSGLVDSLDGNTARSGAMSQLANLIPSPSTANLFVCRPAALPLASFSGFTTPGYVSVAAVVGTRIYGMIASGLHSGYDQPFCYDTATSAYVAISGIQASNLPSSPATTGAWTPPTAVSLGAYVLFTHPGFNGVVNYYGWLDMTGFTLNSATGTTVNGNSTITSVSVDPLTSGITAGMTISDSHGDIPANSYITAVSATTITINSVMTGGHSGNALTIAGGTAAAPLWAAGNTNVSPLPSVPLCVSNFNGRAYFACGNVAYYSDSLAPLNMTNATNSLTAGGADNITALTPQPFFATQTGGINASLLIFKAAQIFQVTGDLALSNLVMNKLIDGVGTIAPRSIENTPNGILFQAADGVRNVNLYGQVEPPNVDLTTPFINTVTPSRSAAAYNEGVYRLCSTTSSGGLSITTDRWFDVNRQIWTGPHSIAYDNIVAIGSTFVLTSAAVPAVLQQSNVLPSSSDTYTENGTELSFTYQTALLPEGPAMSTQTIMESSIFAGFTTQVNLTTNVLDQSANVLLSYTLTSPFYPPANPTNWGLLWEQNVTIPTRCALQISGSSSQGIALGSLFIRFNVQNSTNALNAAAITIPSSLDFGSVADPVLVNILDWGSVADSALASVDFEAIGPLTGPP